MLGVNDDAEKKKSRDARRHERINCRVRRGGSFGILYWDTFKTKEAKHYACAWQSLVATRGVQSKAHYSPDVGFRAVRSRRGCEEGRTCLG
jgi:hypothetical protein